MPEAKRRTTVARKRDTTMTDESIEETNDLDEAEDIDATQTTVKPKAKVVARRDYDEGDEEEPVAKKRVPLPPGVRTGFAGVAETKKSAGGDIVRMTLRQESDLVKFLESENFVTYRQHWIAQGGGQPDRPHTCIGVDCPLCALGDRGSQSIGYNVLHLSTGGAPVNKVLQVGIKAHNALMEAATDKATGAIRIDRDYWAISRSGKGQQSQTNFRPVKQRDLEDDWSEVVEYFDIDDLPSIIKTAQAHCYDASIVQVETHAQLLEVARFAVAADD